MTKKRSSEILGVKMGIFSEKNRHPEILVREKIFRPPKLGTSSPPLRIAHAFIIFYHLLPPYFGLFTHYFSQVYASDHHHHTIIIIVVVVITTTTYSLYFSSTSCSQINFPSAPIRLLQA